ncbi:MAG: U32 family peptidase, partial [Ureaplasma sp.]|nr:U32 family peptidase [Ureaplasma sp.]
MENNLFELLAPAGDMEKAKVALEYGADAIFLGAKIFSLRARASNFSYSDIEEIINYAHERNKKVYIVANVLAHNNLLNELDEYLKNITKCKPDGFIVADPTIIYKLKNEYKDCEIHISTQQSITNSKSALFWKRNSATRVVLARELTYSETKQLVDNVNNQIEIEIFIHGAVCISYSGRCMMSNNFSLRDANVGGCAQSCRWTYEVLNDDIKNKSKFFTMSAKDMSQLENLNELMKLNIASFKIEGRMKSLHYIANVIKNYRNAIDKIKNNNLDLSQEKNELLKSANREFDTAFLSGSPNYTKMLYHDTHIDLSQK